MMFILGKNDIDLIAVEYFEKLQENKTHQWVCESTLHCWFSLAKNQREKAKVIDIDSKTGKDDYNFKVFHEFILFYFFLFNLSLINHLQWSILHLKWQCHPSLGRVFLGKLLDPKTVFLSLFFNFQQEIWNPQNLFSRNLQYIKNNYQKINFKITWSVDFVGMHLRKYI